MPEMEDLNTGECRSITNHKPYWDDYGKVSWRNVRTQHKSLNAEAHCFLPPLLAIPVIFIPGVMGSNLMSKGSGGESNDSVWRGDSNLKIYRDWAKLSGSERRDLLNPNTTEVDSRGRISPDIYSLFSDDGKGTDGTLFPSRKKRGWGSVLNISYGQTLSVLQAALLDDWQKGLTRRADGKSAISEKSSENGILRQLCGEKLNTEEDNESVLNDSEVNHFAEFLFPVHVFGYNWLEDNAVSAESLLKYIDKVLNLYKYAHGHGLAIEKVILVTHSMGGLIARYASQVLGGESKILGIVHGVIPDLGAPAAYRRMKVGARQEGWAGAVMGNSAEELMPVLARAPGPLQLLPSPEYRSDTSGPAWLHIKKGGNNGEDLFLPQKGDPFGEIYLNQDLWWRMYQPDIIDKDDELIERNLTEYIVTMKTNVKEFISELSGREYHHNTYAFYGKKKRTDSYLQWKITTVFYPKNKHIDKKIPNNYREISQPYNRSRFYALEGSGSPGDGTVPVESLNRIRNKKGLQVKSVLATDIEHQGAFDVTSLDDIHHRPALKFTLRAIVKMVQEVPFNP